MQRASVSSSNITSIWYSKETSILEVEFNSWSIYDYFNVPESEYQALLSAASIWSYFSQYIRDNYQFSHVA